MARSLLRLVRHRSGTGHHNLGRCWRCSPTRRPLTRFINLSQGYLSRLKAGDGLPGAPLVSLLAILAAHPELLSELELYWTLPPHESAPRSDKP